MRPRGDGLVVQVIAFDVNGTLLDLGALDAPFGDAFGFADARTQWFALVLQLSLVGGTTGEFVDFADAQQAALTMLAAERDVALDDDAHAALLSGMRTLPPHPEVPAALQRLRESPLRVAALTQSTTETAEAQLQQAGLRDCFDVVIGASDLGALKPARPPYLAVADALRVRPEEVRLVAAHSWDVSGALAAGCHAAFVARAGAVPSPIGRRPDIVGRDLAEVVDHILQVDTA